MKRPVYMDCHSTTPVDPRVLDEMLPYFCERFGNAASRSHVFGWTAEEAVKRGRARVAALIGGRPDEIVFTSGATEANNLALRGAAAHYRGRGDHVVTVATEHRAVLDPARRLARDGFRVTVLPVDRDGLVDPGDVARAIDERTLLVSVMHANNEIGVLQAIGDIGAICRERGVLFHTDAAQSAGKVPLDVDAMNVDLASLSAHKIYGPKGVGALYLRRSRPRVRLEPLLDGGGHERGLRSGTLDVPGIVGFGRAAEIARAEMDGEAGRLLVLRERLRAGLAARVPDVAVNGSLERRLPGNLNVSFTGVESDALMAALRGDVAVSSGSACTSATLEPSHVLGALGVGDERAASSIRFGLGRFHTAEEIDYVAERTAAAVARLRAERARALDQAGGRAHA